MRERTPTERIGLTAYRLTLGQPMTVRQLSAELDITQHGARRMLEKLSLVLPLVNNGGVWQVMTSTDGRSDY
jgi:predicted ArsR family transcriptional regulator